MAWRKVTRGTISLYVMLVYVCTFRGPSQQRRSRQRAATVGCTPYLAAMGVPKLAKWLCERYPTALEHVATNADGEFVRLDTTHSTTTPLPARYDNLYIDLNGIIH